MFGQLPLSKSLSIAFCACLALWVFYLSPFDPGSGLTSFHSDKEASTIFRHDFVPCNDAHGQLITPDLKTAGDERTFDYAPQPYAGSYTALKLPHTWTTASERYRQYGFNRSSNEPLRWDHVDWAQLQKDCLLRNLAYGADRDAVPLISAARRMSLPRLNNHAMPEALRLRPSRPKTTTGRTAIVIRGYSSFKFKEEDFWNLRSLITETSLSYGGKYSVYLLVDVKGDADVFHNAAEYERVLKESVPAEFRNMTVLIDQKNLLAGWYSKIGEHRPEYQIEQARQLFAYHFPEFDHIWQLELDVRFTGHAGRVISALEDFARREPRKQGRERSSYWYMDSVYGSYANFTKQVNAALDGGSAFWNGARIPDVEPIGPQPPTDSARDDAFEWGVGEEADVIILSRTMNITLDRHWNFRNYIHNFTLGTSTPRLTSAPAISRTSYNLLNAMHTAQTTLGLHLPGEATPISFALWHNLKISRPPLPMYGVFDNEYTAEEVDDYLNGGPPSSAHDGMAWGQNPYGHIFGGKSNVKVLGKTWQWKVGYAAKLWGAWVGNQVKRVERNGADGPADGPADVPALVVREGEVWMPNLMVHAVKSNPKRVDNGPG